MKTVLIHGQNHRGSSYHIGRMLAAHFDERDIREFFLPKDLEHFCLGCYNCIEDDEKCPFYDEKKRIMDEVENSDLLIFTTPTYCLRASAPMKAFLDLTFTYWMPHRPRESMFSKKAVVISTAAGTGAKSATKDIKNALFYWGVPYIKEYGVAVQAMSWEQVSDGKKERIKKDIEKLAKTVIRKKIHVGFSTKLLFYGMRMMQNNGWGASPEERDYWRENGWLDKRRPWNT